jgi:hypothetical protein
MIFAEHFGGLLKEVIQFGVGSVNDPPAKVTSDDVAVQAVRSVVPTVVGIQRSGLIQAFSRNVYAEEGREGQLYETPARPRHRIDYAVVVSGYVDVRFTVDARERDMGAERLGMG